MGYCFTIGEARIDRDESCNHIGITVDEITSKDCPDFVDSGRDSSRLPSYSAWADFCRDMGLYDLFLNRDSGEAIIQNHPGNYLLTEETFFQFKAAYDRHKEKHPRASAVTKDRLPLNYKEMGWLERMDFDQTFAPADWAMTRLEWLVFWTRYALDNCENPTFSNG